MTSMLKKSLNKLALGGPLKALTPTVDLHDIYLYAESNFVPSSRSQSRQVSSTFTGFTPRTSTSTPAPPIPQLEEIEADEVYGIEVLSLVLPACPCEQFYDRLVALHDVCRSTPGVLPLGRLLDFHRQTTLPLLGHEMISNTGSDQATLRAVESCLAPDYLRTTLVRLEVLDAIAAKFEEVVGIKSGYGSGWITNRVPSAGKSDDEWSGANSSVVW
ncbi:hypothetical protein G7K_6713-t1 [Saitoella complicata NRRL Y-17804]|uniref:Uncharacterized protein n=1 Tax=Saitoella complicata (strain BCRC 22490 / CBS 7301 / JCM 7358 / NBRC 10748 / NRRL Y-17804) TaxID=698492 RepID=A0A0E9NSJ5_SAICN|nr:hypothetical protein G7K_6713-t1 [Saitoella complicata NRRL Y-17804]